MVDRQKIIEIFKASPTPTSIVLADAPDFTIIQVNDAYADMTQRNEKELLGKSLFKSFPENPDEEKPTGVEKLKCSFQKVIETKEPDEMDAIRYDIVLGGGQYIKEYWKVINTPVFDDDGQVEFIINSATNITEQVLSERANKLMLNNSEDSFIFIDRQLVIQSFNDLFAQNYKDFFDVEVKTGESILKYAQPERRGTIKEIYARVFEGESIEKELPFKNQSGQTRYFNIKYKPAEDENGNIIGSFISLLEKTDEHKAKIELEKREARFRALVENGGDVVFILSPEGQPTYISPSIKNVLGYSPEEAHKMDLFDKVHPDDVDHIKRELAECLEKPGEPLTVTPARLKHKDGSWHWFEGTITNMIHDPAIGGIVDNFHDVTERIEVEKKYRNVVVHSTNMFYQHDTEGVLTYVSPQSKDFLGYTPEKAMKKWTEFVTDHPANKQGEKLTEKAIETGEVQPPYELQLKKADGELIWVEVHETPIKENGKVVGIAGSLTDITARKRYEGELKESLERYDYVSKATRDAIYDWNIKEDNLQWGEGFKNLFGHEIPEETFPIDKWAELVHPNDIKDTMKDMESTLGDSSQTSWSNEYRLLKADGDYVYVVESGHILRDENGNALRMIGAIRDITDKKSAEEKIKQTNEKLKTAQKIAKLGYWEFDLKTEEVYWSEQAYDIWEYDPEEVSIDFDAILERMHPKDREKFKKENERTLQDKVPLDVEHRLLLPDGSVKWLHVSGSIVNNGNDSSGVLKGSVQDITDKKKAEVKLAESFKEKENILESIGDGFFSVDKHWTVTYWNRAAERMLYTSKHEILNQNLWDVFDDAIDLPLYTYYHRAMHQNVAVNFEDYYPPLEKWFDISAYPSPNGISVFFKDITERKTTEERIKGINERFEKVTEATNDAIWDFNVTANKLFWGKGFQKLFGYDLEKIKPSLDFLISLIHPDDRERVSQKIERYMADKSKVNWSEEYRFLKNDDTYAYVMDRAIFIKNKKGKVIRVVGAMTDLTNQKRYEESLKKLNKELGERAQELAASNAELEQFAYVASHDLQEPLRMVSSFLTQLDKKYSSELDDKAKEYINFAVDGAQRMRQIILDLLNYSRLNQDKNKQEKVDLNNILEEVQSLERSLIEEKKAEIEIQKLPVIMGNPGSIKQVFKNLLSNALKYCASGTCPKIYIKFEDLDTHWKFSIEDNGIGINPEFQETIFQIFQRLHTREQYSGTGIGLAISKKIIERHGGEIWVESEEGKGSTFYFTIEK